MVTLFFVGGPAWAASNRVWVSGHGVDETGCGAPTAPCRSLQYAHDNAVAAGGEIDILDPAGYGAITITKAISIVNDGVGTAGVQTTSGIAININANAGDSVYLRGLNIDGVNFTGATGVQFNTGASLTMVGCVVRHFVNYGIALAPSQNHAQINISDTISSNNHGGGILMRPPSGGSIYTNVVIDHSIVQGNAANGITIDGSAVAGVTSADISNSNISNNTSVGVRVDGVSDNQTNGIAYLSRDEIHENASAGVRGGPGGVAYFSESAVTDNGLGDVDNPEGLFDSFGNNAIGFVDGPALTPISLR
jgi:hypothetical protein